MKKYYHDVKNSQGMLSHIRTGEQIQYLRSWSDKCSKTVN